MDKKNILVTGSKGFIGKNLIKKLKNKNVNIFEFNRSNTLDELKDLLLESDFVYHLAGEVRPNSSNTEFKESNTILTKNIVDILNSNDKKIDIVFASSIHAQLLRNEYGKTKRESEILVEDYSKAKGTNCYIFRLPHLFGEGCKPNYNSVVSTWIFNSINNLEINCFDRNIQMNYIYVQDLVNNFVELNLRNKNGEVYYTPEYIYQTTLGEVLDYIDEFKNNIENTSYSISDNDFKSKLFDTYKDYYWTLNVQ